MDNAERKAAHEGNVRITPSCVSPFSCFKRRKRVKRKESKTEVLAPAGSFEIFKAVIAAGADAVYLGGDLFGARAYAGNFRREELIAALDYAHIRQKKVYLTVNTLLKEQELEETLCGYLAPFYEAGLDAAIVQDMGVFSVIQKNFPGLHLHASTQMTITGSHGAKLLETMGAARVVTARELCLEEIRAIRESTDIEIESFVHGALCYCYSGQCLLSSMNGQRSGNRGRCAQPCRLAYTVYDSAGPVNDSHTRYALSPKDMCALALLPDLIEAGVSSMKIEGRMKNAAYAAGVTAIYRKYTDLYQEYGKEAYKVDDEDFHTLSELYNRGGFSTGYYKQEKGSRMMSLARPNHMGTKALAVVNNNAGEITFKALTAIHSQDVFEIDDGNSFTSGSSYEKGEQFVVNLPRKYPLFKGKVLYRTRSQKVIAEVEARFIKSELRPRVWMMLSGICGQPLCLTIKLLHNTQAITVSVFGDPVAKADSQPADREKIAKQLAALGTTEFEAEEVCIELSEDAFIPVGKLKALRREGIERLRTEALERFRRKPGMDSGKTEAEVTEVKVTEAEVPVNSGEQTERVMTVQEAAPQMPTEQKDGLLKNGLPPSGKKMRKTVLVTDAAQLQAAVCNPAVESIYLDFMAFGTAVGADESERIEEGISACKDAGKELLLALPHVLLGRYASKCKALIQRGAALGVDGYLVRNLEEIGLLAKTVKECGGAKTWKLVTDAQLYCWNSRAVQQFAELAAQCGLKLVRVTLPYELNGKELCQIKRTGNPDIAFELVTRADIPLMISEQCLKKTYGTCGREDRTVGIAADGLNISCQLSVCDYCYSILYGKRYDITAMPEWIQRVQPDFVREEQTYAQVEEFYAQRKRERFTGHLNMAVD